MLTSKRGVSTPSLIRQILGGKPKVTLAHNDRLPLAVSARALETHIGDDLGQQGKWDAD